MQDKKLGVKGLGRKKTDESEHFVWKDDIKVPCGRLVPSEHNDSPLEYNEYATYDPKQVYQVMLATKHFSQFIFNNYRHALMYVIRSLSFGYIVIRVTLLPSKFIIDMILIMHQSQ